MTESMPKADWSCTSFRRINRGRFGGGRGRADRGWGRILVDLAACFSTNAIHFFIVFLVPFLMALGSIFLPNLLPKIRENPSKIDAKRPSILDLKF